MTAEIGILNRHGVALAADSAVTISQGDKLKILNTANKLFNLSNTAPVGIMIYGNGSYINTPWDIIIKEYRRQLGATKLDTLQEYANNFFDYLFSCETINSPNIQIQLVQRLFHERLEIVLDKVNRILFNKYEGSKPPVEEVKAVLVEEIAKYLKHLEQIDYLNGKKDLSIKEYKEKYYNKIIEVIKGTIFISLEYEVLEMLVKIGYYAITKDSFINYTGIVIAGYGEKEIFPRIYEYHVNGLVNNFKRYKLNDYELVNGEDNNTARIMPFAQQEMVRSVITGIDPSLYDKVQELISSLTINLGGIVKEIIDNNKLDIDYSRYDDYFRTAGIEIKQEAMDIIQNCMQENFIGPILNMVEMLPKDELAAMAETLVNLTSFKRRITIDEETVGGPVDVAIISKTDGFIWIKRKHYFDREINYNYFNKLRESDNYVFK